MTFRVAYLDINNCCFPAYFPGKLNSEDLLDNDDCVEFDLKLEIDAESSITKSLIEVF